VTKTLDNKNVEITICDMAIQSQPLSQDQIWTIDITPYRSFVDRDIKRNRKQGNKNVEIAICDMAIQSQPLNQAWIWTVDVTPYRSFGDRDLERQEHNATGMPKCRNPI
jgi:hypothetical protein